MFFKPTSDSSSNSPTSLKASKRRFSWRLAMRLRNWRWRRKSSSTSDGERDSNKIISIRWMTRNPQLTDRQTSCCSALAPVWSCASGSASSRLGSYRRTRTSTRWRKLQVVKTSTRFPRRWFQWLFTVDQLLASPVLIGVFLGSLGFLQGCSSSEVKQKVEHEFPVILATSLKVW